MPQIKLREAPLIWRLKGVQGEDQDSPGPFCFSFGTKEKTYPCHRPVAGNWLRLHIKTSVEIQNYILFHVGCTLNAYFCYNLVML